MQIVSILTEACPKANVKIPELHLEIAKTTGEIRIITNRCPTWWYRVNGHPQFRYRFVIETEIFAE